MTHPAARERVLNILLVEDNPADVALAREVMDGSGVMLEAVGDGVEALAYLRRCTGGEGGSLPDLVILDLNMPRMSGGEFLSGIRRDERFGAIPVIVFTSSASGTDVEESYRRGANSFVTKPLELGAYRDALRKMEAFWFRLARLPAAAPHHGGT